MEVISVRETPKAAETAIYYFGSKWASDDAGRAVYEDCIRSCLASSSPLPQWYLMYDGYDIAGCAGLITNDFISRMDLYPWLCALYVEPRFRGRGAAAELINKAKRDAKAGGFSHLYLCTDFDGYYERYGFEFIGTGFHPWGDSSRIYSTALGR